MEQRGSSVSDHATNARVGSKALSALSQQWESRPSQSEVGQMLQTFKRVSLSSGGFADPTAFSRPSGLGMALTRAQRNFKRFPKHYSTICATVGLWTVRGLALARRTATPCLGPACLMSMRRSRSAI